MGHSGATLELAALPPPARPGDRVGVAALSGVVDRERLAAGLAALERLGFEPVPAANLGRRRGGFAGGDRDRLAGFHELAADPTLTAIFFARGGHGLLRLLPAIDWALLARHRRAYVGYSDLTPFLLQVVRRLGLVAFHGPMVAVELAAGLSEEEEAWLLAALRGDYPLALPLRGEGTAGAAGPLAGGCLSMLTATLGTPWAPDLEGSLFFWEDVGEPAYRLDRMLQHLKLAGRLERIRGMIVGRFEGLGADEQEDLLGMVRELSRQGGWPLAFHCPSGHCRPNLTLPLGLAGRLLEGGGALILGGSGAPEGGTR